MSANQWQIGDVKITRLIEIEMAGGLGRIIPDAKRDRLLGIPNADSRARLIVHDGLIGPAWIQRIRADGTAEEIVRRRWTLYSIQAPFPAFALLLVSGLPGAIPALRRRLRKIRRSA